MTRQLHRTLPLIAAAGILLAGSATASASSHMDAPLIMLDPSANTTTFMRSSESTARRPSRRPGGLSHSGAGDWTEQVNFDDNVLYESTSRPAKI